MEINIKPFSVVGGCTTTCIVVTVPGASHRGLWHSPTVLLFSNIFPALINFKSFIVFGPFSLSSKQKTNLQLYISIKGKKFVEMLLIYQTQYGKTNITLVQVKLDSDLLSNVLGLNLVDKKMCLGEETSQRIEQTTFAHRCIQHILDKHMQDSISLTH